MSGGLLLAAVYQSARAVHVIDDVISHDDDDVINYVRPADTGKSIVTTDIRRAGWASAPGWLWPRALLAAGGRR